MERLHLPMIVNQVCKIGFAPISEYLLSVYSYNSKAFSFLLPLQAVTFIRMCNSFHVVKYQTRLNLSIFPGMYQSISTIAGIRMGECYNSFMVAAKILVHTYPNSAKKVLKISLCTGNWLSLGLKDFTSTCSFPHVQGPL